MECVVILKNFIGTGYLFYLYLAALVYLLVTEKEKRFRIMLIYTPLTILFVFLTPFFRWFFVASGLDPETYYRVLWLLPLSTTIAYAGCKLFAFKHGTKERKSVLGRSIGLLVMAFFVILTGTYVYNSPHISKAENLYNIPNATINVCDYILEDAEFAYVYAAFPKEHVNDVRQYTSAIMLAYGREMLVPRWGFQNPIYDLMENPDVIDIPSLLELTREKQINYIVIHWTRTTSDNPENYGLLLLDQIDGLLIYRDEIIATQIRETFGPYYPKS